MEQEVKRQAGWKSKGMAKHYMKEWEVMCASVVGRAAPQIASAMEYERLNMMIGFCRAFAPRKQGRA